MKKELEKIQDKLVDEIEKYFPKIKSKGKNKGRGEACVIVAVAMVEFKKLLKNQRNKDIARAISFFTHYRIGKNVGEKVQVIVSREVAIKALTPDKKDK